MGRYIDVDKVENWSIENYGVVIPEYYDIIDAKELIEDVTPVVHAHWVDRREGFVDGLDWGICSHCKNLLPTLPYCGFCGAKMDEEESE